jgi:hypothetical protein
MMTALRRLLTMPVAFAAAAHAAAPQAPAGEFTRLVADPALHDAARVLPAEPLFTRFPGDCGWSR